VFEHEPELELIAWRSRAARLPRRFTAGARMLEVTYTPIGEGERIERLWAPAWLPRRR